MCDMRYFVSAVHKQNAVIVSIHYEQAVQELTQKTPKNLPWPPPRPRQLHPHFSPPWPPSILPHAQDDGTRV